MDEIILMRKLKRKDEWALGKIIDLYSSYITYIVWELLHKKGTKGKAWTLFMMGVAVILTGLTLIEALVKTSKILKKENVGKRK